ncbi:divalent-cation tolerance protein CutA isoform X1 [Diprion similis]|uniref:divalent-cation tolerance protein CutA isoform X1 n=1 Tax=Diprion similis TaxID=362088 RepID=UPI001EF78D37|nr:divalent-cation tolerance protein CutA isoform X1 [Diprion similis]
MSHTSAVFKFLMLSALVRNIHLLGCSTMSNISGIHSVAYVTVPSNEVAKNISRGLVKNKLAACVNIIPQITSIYEWKGEINEDQEILLMIKTRTEIVDALTKFIKENHPYEVCEVISLPIHNGNKQYLDWISETVPTIAQRESGQNS